MSGPWSAATNDLPTTFANIPENHATAEVLVSVSGTPEAEEAVIEASIPQKATVSRSGTTVEVQYKGTPQFRLIEGSKGVAYAVNTTHTVLQVGSQYFCCENGVWFVAPHADGPWVVADQIPSEIYSIPANSPLHNVTYVYIYDSSPTEVTVGYTSGYEGAYVANGLLMFGAGMALGAIIDNNDWWRWHCKPSYYSYGCHARYSYHHGGYVRAGHHYGPYGGAGYGARYNPWTGAYARGAHAYGPYRSAGVVRAYNPVTGATARGGYYSGPRGTAARGAAYNPATGRGAATRQVRTPYGSWGHTVVSHGDKWAEFGHRSGPRGTTVGGRGSEGRAGVIHKGPAGWSYVGRDKSGDVYAGHGGKVYRGQGNKWQQHSNRAGNWQTTGTRTPARNSRTRPTTSGVQVQPYRHGTSGRRATPTRQTDAAARRTNPPDRRTGSSARQATPSRRTPSRAESIRRLQRDSWSRGRGSRTHQRAKASRSRRGGGRRR